MTTEHDHVVTTVFIEEGTEPLWTIPGQGYYDKFAAKSAPAKVLYKVQCGAFSKKSNADALAATLKAKGHETYIVQAGGLYKVQCGTFEVKANADKLAATLKVKASKPI